MLCKLLVCNLMPHSKADGGGRPSAHVLKTGFRRGFETVLAGCPYARHSALKKTDTWDRILRLGL